MCGIRNGAGGAAVKWVTIHIPLSGCKKFVGTMPGKL
jgi:hypothetical protein